MLIVENTDIQHQDQRNLNRTNDTGGGLTLKGNITGTSKTATRTATAGVTPDVNVNRSFTGTSAYNINQTFTDTVTCTVVAVQPNGNLVIEGFRQRTVTREVRTLRLSRRHSPDTTSPWTIPFPRRSWATSRFSISVAAWKRASPTRAGLAVCSIASGRFEFV